MTGHIQSLVGHVRTRPDISGLRARHIRSFRVVSIYQMSIAHGFFIGSSHLIPSALLMISLIFGYFFLKVMTREAHERRTKHREVAGASSSS
jgi:hypothetical protein